MNNTRKLIENFPLKDWYDLSLRKEMYSLFIDKDVAHQVKCVKWELDELLEWVEKWDIENISEEMGDVIFTTISLLQSLLKKWLVDDVDLKVSWLAQKHKIYKRQPFLKTHQKPESFEHEHDLFMKQKKWLKEKNSKTTNEKAE